MELEPEECPYSDSCLEMGFPSWPSCICSVFNLSIFRRVCWVIVAMVHWLYTARSFLQSSVYLPLPFILSVLIFHTAFGDKCCILNSKVFFSSPVIFTEWLLWGLSFVECLGLLLCLPADLPFHCLWLWIDELLQPGRDLHAL